MFDTIVHTFSPITLVGGGSVTKSDLKLAISLAPVVVAADGGAAAALQSGAMPAAVIGDFDSLDASTKAQIPAQKHHFIEDQNTTDFEKALGSIDAPCVIGVGFTGGRLDHQLAACSALMRFSDRPCVLLGEHEVMFHCPTWFNLEMARDDVVSLYPLVPVTGRSSGLRWPIDGLTLTPGARLGTSNAAVGGTMTLETDGPGLLGLLPRRYLADVTKALSRS